MDGREDPNNLDDEETNGEHETQEDADPENPEDDGEASTDEGSPDEPGEDEEEIDAQPERKQSRAEGRIARLARETREAREEAAATRRELQQVQQDIARQRAAAAERDPTDDEMSLWTPQQIMDHKLGKATKATNAALAQMQFTVVNSADKAAFNSMASADPMARRYAAEVEKRHAELVAAGQYIEREKLLTYVIGEAMRNRRGPAADKVRKEGKQRIQREQQPLSNGRGDVQRGREKLSESAAREKRLSNVTF